MTALELDDAEKAALIEWLTTEIKGTRFPLSPRLRPLKSVLAKLSVGSTHAPVYPTPKPPGQPSAVLAPQFRDGIQSNLEGSSPDKTSVADCSRQTLN